MAGASGGCLGAQDRLSPARNRLSLSTVASSLLQPPSVPSRQTNHYHILLSPVVPPSTRGPLLD
jgi:hypothetical protein